MVRLWAALMDAAPPPTSTSDTRWPILRARGIRWIRWIRFSFLPDSFFFSLPVKNIRASKNAVTSFPGCRVSRGKIEIRIVAPPRETRGETARRARKRESRSRIESIVSERSDFIIAMRRLPRLIERHFIGRSIG
jgi:hypothetical protein